MGILFCGIFFFRKNLFDNNIRPIMRHANYQVLEGQARLFRCEADIDWMEEVQPYYPPTVNDPEQVTFNPLLCITYLEG
jgi:hypothetical protein